MQGLAVKELRRGYVASNAKDNPALEALSFEAQVIVMNHRNIMAGYSPVLDCHTAHIACKFASLRNKVDRRTNKIMEEEPKSVKVSGGVSNHCAYFESLQVCNCQAGRVSRDFLFIVFTL